MGAVAVTISQSDVLGMVPTITLDWAQIIADAVTSEAARAGDINVADFGAQAEARLIMLQAVRVFALGKPWLATEGTGPYSAGYRERVGAGILTAADMDRLREISGQGGPTPPVPIGAFPEPVSYNYLFWPGRSSW